MKKLIELLKIEQDHRFIDLCKTIRSALNFEELNFVTARRLNKKNHYSGNLEQRQAKAIKLAEKQFLKGFSQSLKFCETVAKSTNEVKPFTVQVIWDKSRMWGNCPHATDTFGHTAYAGGCGYCKLSTVTADILNQHPEILKRLYAKKEELLPSIEGQECKNPNSSLLGYGSGYGIFPYFEGGVGVECHISILEKLNITMKRVISTDRSDVYSVFCNEVAA